MPRVFIICLGFSMLAGIAPAHEMSTHTKITREAVAYLMEAKPRLRCAKSIEADLQIGTVDEDDGHRVMYHFSPHLNDTTRILVVGDRVLVDRRVSASCDSLQWAFSNKKCRQSGFPLGDTEDEQNDHSWSEARRKRFNGGWVELGYLVHLLQDLGSPAHTRNDAHHLREIDPFEKHNEGFIPIRPYFVTTPLIEKATPHEFFEELKQYTQKNFFSNDTVFDPAFPGPDVDSENNRYFYDIGRRRLAHKGEAYNRSKDRRDAEIDAVIAREQFEKLGPIIVRYVASFLWHYIKTMSPRIEGCPSDILTP